MDPKVQEFVLEEEVSSWAVVLFESSRGAVQRLQGIDSQERSQVLLRGYEACLYCDTARVFELAETSKTTAVLEEVFDNCISINEEEQLEVLRVLRGF